MHVSMCRHIILLTNDNFVNLANIESSPAGQNYPSRQTHWTYLGLLCKVCCLSWPSVWGLCEAINGDYAPSAPPLLAHPLHSGGPFCPRSTLTSSRYLWVDKIKLVNCFLHKYSLHIKMSVLFARSRSSGGVVCIATCSAVLFEHGSLCSIHSTV